MIEIKDFLIKKENETDNQYISRVYKAKTELEMTNKQVANAINLELGTNYAESSLRGVAKYYCEGYDDGFENGLKVNGANDMVKEIEEKTKLLEKEKIKFQDQKREYKAFLRADARFDHLKSEMIKEIQRVKEYKPLYNEYKRECNSKKEASLILSDIHLGMTIDDKFNKYNKEIAQCRLNTLANKTINYCKLNNVNTLHIELLGDLTNGYLHIGNRVNNEEDVISQTILISEMLSNFIKILSDEIPNIKVYSTIGNHGRCSANLKDSLHIENFERLIIWYIEARLDCDNVDVIKNDYDEIITYQALNKTIFAVHGHRDNIKNAIDSLSKYLKKFPDEIHMGHYHKHLTMEDNDIELIVNGSFAGTDEFAESIRKSNKPSQTLIIYDEEGQECLYKINL